MGKIFKLPIMVGRVTSKFGYRNIGRGREWHQGVDLAGPKPGDRVPVYASADGVVKAVGALSSYGNRVLIHHVINGKVYETNYAHLGTISVKKGQEVKQGQLIGIMGNTSGGLIPGMAVHLHFEIHDGLYAPGQPKAVDPMKYVALNDWTVKEPEEPTKPIEEEDDDKMKFTNDATKNAVRDHIAQMVKNGYIGKQWLADFDSGKMTQGDYDGLKLISDQKKAQGK